MTILNQSIPYNGDNDNQHFNKLTLDEIKHLIYMYAEEGDCKNELRRLMGGFDKNAYRRIKYISKMITNAHLRDLESQGWLNYASNDICKLYDDIGVGDEY